eukprot:TRINITY_DN8255_c0_g3_i1.p1 TRINITY_DN8255_c0_g3~~TRINITY_DN8255_c0_g3_i1.p1  ORF type:complete len:326 (-),score=63.48 TRINITY_DN8255_c0_g3_i1:19-996(-)
MEKSPETKPNLIDRVKQRSASAAAKKFSMEEMFRLSRINSSTWGIEGYDPVRKYADPIKQVQDREFSAGKKKPAPRLLKKGHYLTDTFRSHQGKPGPIYNVGIKWVPNEKPKTPAATKRGNYIDDLKYLSAIPGPGTYFKGETDRSKTEKRLKHSEGVRPNFLCDYEWLGDQVPGPGSYEIGAKPLPDGKLKMKPKEWIQYHHKLEQTHKERQGKMADMATYNAWPVTFSTFGKNLYKKEVKEDLDGVGRVKYWGTAKRFNHDDDSAKKKGKSEDNRPKTTPGPGTYDLIAHWAGKKLPKRSESGKPRDVLKQISHEPVKSIYYE